MRSYKGGPALTPERKAQTPTTRREGQPPHPEKEGPTTNPERRGPTHSEKGGPTLRVKSTKGQTLHSKKEWRTSPSPARRASSHPEKERPTPTTRRTGHTQPASSSAPYPQELNPWSSSTEEPLHSSTVEKSERRTQDQDLRCQSGPSAKNSVIFSGATFACWKIRFKTEVCTCSQLPTEAMQWIKEVEMVDSVDNLKSSCSMEELTPDFEVLDAKIASALNRIIHNTQFKREVSLEEQKSPKEDRFFRGRRIAHLIYEYFPVTGANDSVENYADLFAIVLRNDDIQALDSKWDEILLSKTKIPPDDILEGLYKVRIRESEKLKTVLEWNCTTWTFIRRQQDLLFTD